MIKDYLSPVPLKIFLVVLIVSCIYVFCSAQNINMGTTNLLPNKIMMPSALVQDVRVDVGSVDLLEYIRGVCRAELGVIGPVPGKTLSDTQRKEAYKALSIAAATNLAKKSNGAGAVTVENSESFQTYLPASAMIAKKHPEVNTLIDEACPVQFNLKHFFA